MQIEVTPNGHGGTTISLPDAQQGKSHSWEIGKAYFVQSVTYDYTGRLIEVTDTDLVLEDAAWIADSGRFGAALKTGVLNEVEPYPSRVIIQRSAIVDAAEWLFQLPRENK